MTAAGVLPLSLPRSLPPPSASFSPAAWAEDAKEGGEREPADVRLARLAAAIGPLRRVLAAIAERLVAARGYERLCYARLSDYARERPGISGRQLQELARVDRALAGLPALERVLVTNALPWSKVRLVARVAYGEDEEAWIARASEVSTRRLEQEVRACDAGPEALSEVEGESETRVAVRCTPAVREKWSQVHELAERVAGQRLRGAEVLELVAAEAFAALSIAPAHVEEDARREGRPELREAESGAETRVAAPDLPSAVAALARGLPEADATELDRRLCAAIRLEQTLDAAMAPLLRIVGCAEYGWSRIYHPMGRFAREELGMSASKARALVRIERAGDVCPELREAYRSGRLSWVKAQCLLPLLLIDMDGEWRPAWVAWAERVTLRRLEADVEQALLLRAGHDAAWQRCKFHPERALDAIPESERQMCAHDIDTEATERLAWRVPRDVAALFRAMQRTFCLRTGRPLREGEAFAGLLELARLAWTERAPGARRPDPVIERDGYRCTVPGCSSRRNLHDHHVLFRSRGGSDTADNRITLCAFHHLRCLHAGRMTVRGRAPDELVFRLPLARYRSGDVVM